MQEMSMDGLVIKSTENHKKFYDYLAKNYPKFILHNGEYRTVLKELEEVIYMLLLLILSEDEEPDPENSDGINMLYDTLRVLVQLYNNVLNSSDIKEREKASLIQHPEVHKLLLSQRPQDQNPQEPGNDKMPLRDMSLPLPLAHGAENLLDLSGDFYGNLGMDLGNGGQYGILGLDKEDTRQEAGLFHDLESVIASSDTSMRDDIPMLDQTTSSLKMKGTSEASQNGEVGPEQLKSVFYDQNLTAGIGATRELSNSQTQRQQVPHPSDDNSSIDLNYMVSQQLQQNLIQPQSSSTRHHLGVSLDHGHSLTQGQPSQQFPYQGSSDTNSTSNSQHLVDHSDIEGHGDFPLHLYNQYFPTRDGTGTDFESPLSEHGTLLQNLQSQQSSIPVPPGGPEADNLDQNTIYENGRTLGNLKEPSLLSSNQFRHQQEPSQEYYYQHQQQ